jgi:hypothetical protein
LVASFQPEAISYQIYTGLNENITGAGDSKSSSSSELDEVSPRSSLANFFLGIFEAPSVTFGGPFFVAFPVFACEIGSDACVDFFY